MRFPAIDELHLPCRFADVVPGKLHPDGRRYLPQLIFDLPSSDGGITRLGVVDRHHRVDLGLVGRAGVAKLIWLLGSIQSQQPPLRQGLFDERSSGRISGAPGAWGQIALVPAWEAERERLSYQALYLELVLDIGIGTVGVRTSATAPDLAAKIGTTEFRPGDWAVAGPARIDILAFVPDPQ